MTDLQVKYQSLKETQRTNLANEAIKAKDVETKIADLENKKKQAEAALIQAKAAKKTAEVRKWEAILSGVTYALDAFTLTPSSQAVFFKNVGQGFGSSTSGAASLLSAIKGGNK